MELVIAKYIYNMWSLFIVLPPLAGFLFNLVLGPRLPKSFVGVISVIAIWAPFLIVLYLFWENLGGRGDLEQTWFSWLEFKDFNIAVSFRIDELSLIMGLVVTGIGGLIHLYSTGYMWDEQYYARFFAYMNLFVFFMLLLILSSELVLVFVGWEGVGLCSYLLIGFDHHRMKAAKAAKKAFVINRIGDVGFLLAMFGLFTFLQTFNIGEINLSLPFMLKEGQIDQIYVDLICLLFFLAATGKSAQFPLFTWLPDAMEGPTPVSALIHAATMVTSGVYLIARMWPVFNLSEIATNTILYGGIFTALISALIATRQWDIKKVLAYSTISQLGYMFMALGVASYTSGMFHLVTHAFFKALLFLGAGSVILKLHHEQDIRKMQGLKKIMADTMRIFAIGAWCIAGLPFGASFFSKDEILWQLYSKAGVWVWGFAFLGSFLTAYYTYRLFYIVFYKKSSIDFEQNTSRVKKEPFTMRITLWILALGSIIIGFFGLPAYLGKNLFKSYLSNLIVDTELAIHNYFLEILLLIITLFGIALAWFIARRNFKSRSISLGKDKQWTRLLEGRFFLDEIYHDYLVVPILKCGKFIEVYIDDILYNLPRFIYRSIRKTGIFVGSSVQNGNLQNYAFAISVALLFFIAYSILLVF